MHTLLNQWLQLCSPSTSTPNLEENNQSLKTRVCIAGVNFVQMLVAVRQRNVGSSSEASGS